MHWNKRTKTPIEKGQIIQHCTVMEPQNNSLLMVSLDRKQDFEEFQTVAAQYRPFSIVPPFDINNPAWTSRAANRTFDNIDDPIHVGVVVSGKSDWEREDFLFWAQHQGYAPIILLPDAHKTRQHQLASLVHKKLLHTHTWLHLAGSYEGVDLSIADALITVGPSLWEI